MGPKYEFTGETMHYGSAVIHRIKRLSDGKIGGWIEKEENLSQEGNCWVDGDAKVYDDAKVYGNAQVYDTACVGDNAQVYGNAKVYACVIDNAKVYGNAEVQSGVIVRDNTKVYDNAKVYCKAWVCGNAKIHGEAFIAGEAKIYGNAEVYGKAHITDNAEVHGNAKVYNRALINGDAEICGTAIIGNDEIYDNVKINSGKYTTEEFSDDSSNSNETKKVVQDFIYKVDDSSKLTTQTEYDSIDEFFSEPITNDIKLDTLIICAVDTKEPLIKLQKVEAEDKTEFKFIVEITNEDGDNFVFRSIIKSQEHLNQLIQRTVEALKQYPEFTKYTDDLEEYI